MKKVCIIGGGISGLVAAFLLRNKGFDVTLFEKSNRIGGNIQTVNVDGFTIEYAPNSLLKSPRLVDLIKELKLEDEVLAANAANKKRYVLRDGKLRALPMSVAKMAANDFFSWKAKLRLLKEPFIKSKSPNGESVAEFFNRRFGREIVEKAADPFIAGIYAGNPENLSVKAAFPRLYELEKDYGSLLVGSLRSKTEKADASFPRSFSFINGIQTLTDKLLDDLGENIKTETRVLKIERTTSGKYAILTERRQNPNLYDAVIISTPAESATDLIEDLDADLSKQLKDIYYPPVVMIFCGFKKENILFNLDGFGFLVPSSEKRRILGTVWNSAVFTNRAPENYHLLTTFVGGSRNAELFEKSDAELAEIVFEELRGILHLTAKPDFLHTKRWQKAIPQYNLGYEKVEKSIEDFTAENQGIFFCSNFYKGISVGDCVKNAYQTAAEIEQFLREGNLQELKGQTGIN